MLYLIAERMSEYKAKFIGCSLSNNNINNNALHCQRYWSTM